MKMSRVSILVNDLGDFYAHAMNTTDPRVANYPLIWNDPRPVLSLIAVYFCVILFGKKLMEKRAAFNIPGWFLFAYNFALVIISVYMFYEIIAGVIEAKYDILCAKYTMSYAKAEMRVTNALWLYFFSKAIEMLDTVWMILRKKFNQITFLHVFHHSSMLFIWWVVVSWIPGGQSYFGACMNSLIHIFMYSYYALSAIPSLREKLWWKKYITSFQLIQFVITFAHTIQGIVRSCEYPKWGQYFLSFYMILMLALFSNFYREEYLKKAKVVKHKRLDRNNNLVKKNGHGASEKISKDD